MVFIGDISIERAGGSVRDRRAPDAGETWWAVAPSEHVIMKIVYRCDTAENHGFDILRPVEFPLNDTAEYDLVSMEGAVTTGLRAAEAVRRDLKLDQPVELRRPKTSPRLLLVLLRIALAPIALVARALAD